jgi:FkbM family methyltransferase
MKTVLGDILEGWDEIGTKIIGNSFIKNNELLRCEKHKEIEAKYLLSLPRNTSFLDIGSNYGDTVLTMALHASKNNRKDIRFFAFEPNNLKCEVIKKVAERNKLSIQVYNNCVGNSNGFAVSDDVRSSLEGGCSYKFNKNNGIKIIKIDDIQKIIEPVGLIHVDTEGWEVEVLRGCHNILSNQINHFILIAECWSDSVAREQKRRGRTNNIVSDSPRNDIINLISHYKFNQLSDIIDRDENVVFQIN